MVERPRETASDEQLAASTAPTDAVPATAPKDAVVGWLTDFDSPAVGVIRERRLDHRVIPPGVVPRTRVPLSAFIAVTAGIGAALVAIASMLEPRWEFAPAPVVAPTSTSSPPPPTRPEPTPAPVVSLLPDSCGDFFSAKMEKKLKNKDLKLYTPDSLADDSLTMPTGRDVGTSDTQLAKMLAGVAEIECYWLHESGPELGGVLTTVGEGRERQLQLARKRLGQLDLTRVEEHGGIRYYEESADASGMPVGESHFFKGGVWFATSWYGYGPRGYSVDMAESVLGRR